jgi:hypothetical protein
MKGRSGRKGALVEQNNAEILHDMFFTDQGKEEIIAKLKTGKYSLKDVFVQKGFAGNERVLLALFNKNFADATLKVDVTTGGEKITAINYIIPKNGNNPEPNA